MAANKQTNAFLTALLEKLQNLLEIAREVWGWVARVWKERLSRHWLLIALLGYLFLSYFIHGHVQPVNPKVFELSYWLTDSPDKVHLSETIRNLVLAIGGWLGLFAAFIGLLLAYQRTNAANQQSEAALKQSVIALEALTAERFTRAVEQLGHEKRAMRLWAIYALERIAKDSARDSETIVETLAAYIREHTPWPPRDANGVPPTEVELEREKARDAVRPPIDIDAALNVICRLLPTDDPMRQKTELRDTDLRGLDAPGICLSRMRLDGVNLSWANLSGAELNSANLRKANLRKANLRKANLRKANLSEANLSEAELNEADLTEAILSGACLSQTKLFWVNLSKADLKEVNLNGAKLFRANLSEADLKGADLSGADLEGVKNLTQ